MKEKIPLEGSITEKQVKEEIINELTKIYDSDYFNKDPEERRKEYVRVTEETVKNLPKEAAGAYLEYVFGQKVENPKIDSVEIDPDDHNIIVNYSCEITTEPCIYMTINVDKD